MVTLFCALVGAEGSAFPVDIDASKSVGHLKDAIWAKIKRNITCDAWELELYLAKKDEAWLKSDGANAATLDEHGTPQIVDEDGSVLSFVKMDPSWDIVDYFAENFERKRGEIHVLVVVPTEGEERGAKRQKVEEAPDIWMTALHDERVDILPLDCDGLKKHLERELRVKIPITDRLSLMVSVYDNARKCSDTFNKLFEPCQAFSVETGMIVGAVINPMTFGSEFATEDTYHHLWDSLIAVVLRHASIGNFRRNSNASTSTGLCRPDLCFYYDKRNVCVFRGEEKSNGEMQVPITELYEKLIWRYDDAPYVFGYAAVGFQVCLVVIRKDSTKPRVAKAEVIDYYDLSELDGRLSFLLALLNLSTLFRPVVELIQPFSIPDYGILCRTNGVTISFAEDCVIKEYPLNLPSNSIINNLKTLHGQMKDHSVPNVVTLVKANLKKRHVILAPVGIVAPPSDVKQLVTALRDLLTALVALHKLNLMHRDLRWDNVLKYQDRDEWFLIDFDEGALAPATQGALHLDPMSHAPEIASSHSVKVDIWGVGYLLRTTTVLNLPHPIEAIQEQCLQKSPSKRPTAASLLKVVQKLVLTLA